MLPDDQPHSPFNPQAQRAIRGKPPADSNTKFDLGSLTGSGSIKLFRVAGITVFLHWTWFLVAVYQIQSQRDASSPLWLDIAEYLALFGIVLMHEFGHALACRSVGGKAERIVLWPLGGVAYVQPPPRPGALLWSIFAGPLVNIFLLPITWLLYSHTVPAGFVPEDSLWSAIPLGNLANFTRQLFEINAILLAYNLLPIYPLDGGQILQALLWFVIGRARSMMVAACVGLLGAVGMLALAAHWESIWFAVLAFFGGSMAWRSLQTARSLLAYEKAPRRPEVACPHCGSHPPVADRWRCANCGQPFDAFATAGQCPHCGVSYNGTICFDCGKSSPIANWHGTQAPLKVQQDSMPADTQI